jgi:hypothetical protein
MLNPISLVLTLIGRFIGWTGAKPRPRPDRLGRQGAQSD